MSQLNCGAKRPKPDPLLAKEVAVASDLRSRRPGALPVAP